MSPPPRSPNPAAPQAALARALTSTCPGNLDAEKPVADTTANAEELAALCENAGVKNGVVQDKLFLPGMIKLRRAIESGFFGRILSIRGEFGYWVFDGKTVAPNRPSWNYRKEEGGGIILDMLAHWRYVLDELFGKVKAVSCLGATHIPERVDEDGQEYPADADDAAYATFQLEGGAVAHFNSSWVTRVRRDDLLTLLVDGTQGSAMVGLRNVWLQHAAGTPKPVWNPDIEQPIDFFEGWTQAPEQEDYPNAFRAEWELFLRHVAAGEAEAPTDFPYTLREGVKGVELAELGYQSWQTRQWVDIPER